MPTHKNDLQGSALRLLSSDEIEHVSGGLTVAELAARQLYYTSRLMQINDWMTEHTRA